MANQESTYLLVFHLASASKVFLATQRLWRLAEGAQESAPHAISIGKSAFSRHHIDGKLPLLHHRASGFDP
jgi:hypothetical protein